MKENTLRDWVATAKITDRQMKKSWEESIDADGFENETEVELAIIMQLSHTWDPKKYDIDVRVQEKLIKVPKLILPE